MLCLFITTVEYFETLVKYFGHLAIIAILWGYSLLDNYIEGTLSSSPTLEDIALLMNRVSLKSDILLSPWLTLERKIFNGFYILRSYYLQYT